MKVSTTGYKKNSKDKKHKELFIPGNPDTGNTLLTMLGVEDYVQATPVYPNGNFGGSVMMKPGVPSYNFPGAMGVIEQKLPKAQKGKPVYVESKNDPQYIQYQKDLSHYNKQKSRYEALGDLVSMYGTYDDYVKSYYNDPPFSQYHFPYDPHLGYKFYWENSTEPDYAFRKPTPVIYQEPVELESRGFDFKFPEPKPLDIKRVAENTMPVQEDSIYGITDLGGNIGMIRKGNGVAGYVPLDSFFGTPSQLDKFYNDSIRKTRQGYPLSKSDFEEWGSNVNMRPTYGDVEVDIREEYSAPKTHKSKMAKGGSLSKPPKKGLTWGDYLKKRGITDKDILSLGQDQIDSTFNRSIVGDYKKFPEIFKQDTDGKLDIKNQIYNEYLNSLISDYNDVYPISDNGNRITVSNIVSKKGWRDPEIFGLTDEQYYQVGAAASLDNADSEKFIDMYFKNQDKYNTMNLEKEGKGYRDVPVKWVDAYPKYSLKGIDAYNPESPGEFRRDSRNLFRYPVLYDDKILGKQDIPLLGADWMRNYYKKAGTKHFTTRSSRDDHNNPAIYPKPNYSMEEVNPVLSGSPNYGSNFRINSQDYTIAQPDQNYIQNQFYGLPISAMPGPSAENIYVDSPNSDWVRNYKNKMNLYNVTQENLARLKEYDPNYILDTAPLTEDDRRVVGYENQYINDPSVGFYQTDPNEEIKEPCESCGTLYGSTKTGDADTTYQTYDVQYPQYGVFKKEDLDPKPRYYIERSGEYGNPGVAHIYRANLTDPTNPQNRDYLGAVLADEWLSGDTLENFYGSGYQYREPIDYEGLKDGRRVWREGTENWDELEPYAILDQRAKEPAERGARERYKKKMQEISDMQVGDPETESRRQQYVKEKLGMLNNFINNSDNPRARGKDYSGPSFKKGGENKDYFTGYLPMYYFL